MKTLYQLPLGFVHFLSNHWVKKSLWLGMFMLTLALSAQAQITGTVFKDFNANGQKDGIGEIGVGGVSVKAIRPDGSTAASATTSSSSGTLGQYSLTVSGAASYRIEFSIFPSGFFSGPKGSGSSTTIQFVNGNSGSANLGINYPSDYCETNPIVATPCYVNGDPTKDIANNSKEAGLMPVLVSWNYAAQDNLMAIENQVALGNQMGSTWGLAYQRESKFLFASALMKRHVGFGPGGTGAVYKVTNANANSGFGVSTFFKLSDYGISAGADPHTGLTGDKSLSTLDNASFNQVGRVGIGDMDLSEDGSTLFLVNLNDKKLYSFNIGNPGVAPANENANDTQGNIRSYTIPNPNCANSESVPWGLKYYRGKLYVGVVCTAETSQNKANLKATVYEFDPSTGTFTNVMFDPSNNVGFSLNFKRGSVFCDDASNARAQGDWRPWRTTNVSITNDGFTAKDNAGAPNEPNESCIDVALITYPQPILSDIEFDADGSMIIGFSDRFGNQSGRENQDINGNLFSGFSQGDLLRAGAKQGGGWSIENNGTANGVTTLGQGNNEGPGGGEFYFGDITVDHHQSAQGGIAIRLGSGEVMTTIIDPEFDGDDHFWSGGTRKLNNISGDHPTDDVLVYDGSDPLSGALGKANGLGDLEVLCGLAPIEIGNRVWNDTDGDGIQDAGEAGINGVTVLLFKKDINGNFTNQVASQVTSGNGEYYFTNLEPNTDYQIRVVASQAALNTLKLTQANAGSNDEIDSDASLSSGNAIIVLQTDGYGENNHTYDLGFNNCPTVEVTAAPVCIGSTLVLNATGTNIATYSWAGPVSFSSTSASPSRTNVTTAMGGIYTVTVANSASCSVTGTASAVIKPAPSATASSNTPVCAGNTIQLSAAGGSGYTWAGPGGFSSTEQNPTRSNATTSMSGTYSVVVAGTNSCTASATTSVTVNPKPNIVPTSFTACEGGTITIGATDGGTYSWAGPGGFTSTAQNPTRSNATTAMSGTYTVTVQTTASCTATATATVSVTPAPLLEPQTAAFCPGGNATLSALGGVTYSWSTGATTSSITVTTGGTYNVTITSQNGCKAIGTFEVTEKPKPVIDPSSNSPVCLGTTIELSASGGGSYNWAGPAGFISTEQNPTRTNATTAMAGVYSVIVTGTNSCTNSATTSVVVNITTATASASSPICVGSTLKLSATGGGTYAWSGPNDFTSTSQNPTRSNVTTDMAGVYTVTVTKNGCTATATTSVVINNQGAVATSNSPICQGNIINLSASSGALYSWTGPGGFTATIQNPTRSSATTAMTGVYSVTVAGQNSCTGTATTSVIVNPKPTASAKSNSPVCLGQTISLTAEGGENYSWAGPSQFSSTDQTPSISNATSANGGVYTVTVMNENGCTATATTSVSVNITTATASANSPVCLGGQIQLSASGGGTYSWAGPASFSSTVQNPIRTNATTAMGGIYSVTVTKNNCTASATVSVVINTQGATAISNSPVCEGDVINLSASPGTGYSWTGPGGFTASNQAPSRTGATTAMAGVYFVSVTGSNGCTGTATVSVTVNTKPKPTIDSNSPVCVGSTIELTALGGDSYQWAGPDKYSSTEQFPKIEDATTANGGIYTVTVKTEAGCSATATISVQIKKATATAKSNSPLCVGATIQLSATGGVEYLWTGPANFESDEQNPVITNVTTANAGVYSVTVQDQGGCTASATTSVQIKTQGASAESNSPICEGFVIQLSASNGSGYAWAGPSNFSSTVQNPSRSNATTAMGGVYTVTVKGTAGCTGTATASVVINPKPSVTASSNTPICEKETIELSASGGVAYTWSGPAGFSSTQQSPTRTGATTAMGGLYSVTIKDELGCTNSTTTSVKIKPLATFDAEAISPTCKGTEVADDGKLKVSNVKNGDRVGYSLGETYTGPAYNGAVSIPQNGILVSNLPNPNEEVVYIIRIYNGSNECFTDKKVTLKPGVCQLGSLGDYVWFDQDGDGLQDIDEPGVKNVKVTLYAGDKTTVLETTITDADGKYLFDSLQSGDYFVKFDLPATYSFTKQNQGADDAIDSDAGTDGFSQKVTIDTSKAEDDIARNNPTIDAGILQNFGSIGDYVWKDLDADGIQDDTEKGVKGITVTLFKEIQGVFTAIETTITDLNGKYLFDSLGSGKYKVKFTNLPPDCTLTEANQGNDDTKDSDAGEDGFSPVININVDGTGIAKNNLTVDAGLILPYGSIGDFVWKDLNANGIQDENEPGIAKVEVILYKEIDGKFVVVETMLTSNTGKYTFDSLLTGNYQVKFNYVTPDCKLTTPDQGNDDKRDSDADKDGFSPIIKIDTSLPFFNVGRNNSTIDAGYIYTLGSLGDFVWSDDNKNGIQDAGEKGVPNVKVILYVNGQEGFEPLDSTFTDANGKYLFDSLKTGKYQVQFILPAGKVFTLANQGSDDAIDSDADANGLSHVVTIDTSKPANDLLRNNPTIDAGLIPECVTPPIKPGPDQEICVGETAKLVATTNKGVDIYWYTVPTGGTPFDTTQSGEVILVSPLTTTTYYAEAVIPGLKNCKSGRVPIVVTVNAKPGQPSCSGNTTNVCPELTVNLTKLQLSPISIPGGKFEWHTGDKPSSPLVADPTKVGKGKYYLFEKSPKGCYSEPSLVVVNINKCECLDPPMVMAGNDQKVCTGDTIRLKGSFGGTAAGAIWSTGTGGKFGNPKSLITYYVPSAVDIVEGKVTITLTTIDNDPDDACDPVSDALIVTICPRPKSPYNLSCADSTLCLGYSTKLFAYAPGSKINWYTTPTGGAIVGTTDSGEGFVVTPSVTTTYWAEAVSIDGGCSSTKRSPIEVKVKKCYADLAVDKKIITTPKYKKGQEIIYSLTVSNLGPVKAEDVKVIDKLPASLTFVAAIPPGVYNATTGVWTIGTLTAGSSKVLEIKATINVSAIITNTAYVTSPDNDLTKRDNDTSRVTITSIEKADLSLVKSISGDISTALVGDTLTYHLTVKNAGPCAATNIKVKDYLPAGLKFVSSSSAITHSAGVLTGTIASLDSGAIAALAYKVKVIDAGVLKNCAEIAAVDQIDPDSKPGNGVGNEEDDEDCVTIETKEPCHAKPPVLSCTDCYTICIGQKVVLYADGCEGYVEWSTGEKGPSITLTPKVTTDYWAVCVLSKNCRSEKAEGTIKVGNPQPPVLTCSNLAICYGEKTTIKAAGCSGTIVWSNGFTGGVITVKPIVTTKYFAYCKVGTCLSDTSNILTVSVTPPIKKPEVTDLVNTCPEQTVNLFLAILSAPVTIGGAFEFHTGPTPTSPLVENPTKISKSGTYYIFEKSVIGCYSEVCTIHVLITDCNPMPPCVTNPATADAGPDAAICADKSYTLNGKIGGAASSGKWSTSGKGTFDNPFSLTATYTASQEDFEAGYVYLILTTNDPDGVDGRCVADVDSMKLTINGIKLKPSVTITGSLNPCFGDSVKLTANPDGYGYLWTNGATTRSIWVKKSGIYNVRLVDKYGCKSLECEPIEVKVAEPIPTPVCGGVTTNVCPSLTVDLTKAVTSKPATAGGAFEYHTGSTPTSPVIINPTAVGAGTYYVFERGVTGCYSAPEPIIITITDCKPAPYVKKADLSLSKHVNLTNCKVGNEVIFTLQVKNIGPDTATNVVVTDFLPEGMEFASGSLVTHEGNKVKATFSKIANHDSASVAFSVKITKAGTITNQAEITAADQPDPDSQPNSGLADGQDDMALASVNGFIPDIVVPVNPPVIGLAKSVSDVSQNIVDNSYNITYQFVVKNFGQTALFNVQVLDSLSKVFTSASGATFSIKSKPSANAGSSLKVNPDYNGTTDARLLLEDLSNLAVGKSDTVRFTVNVLPGTESTYYNTALATGVGKLGTLVMKTSDVSTDGTNPDPNSNGIPFDTEESKITPLTLVLGDIDNLFIPEGFSPNGDGINDTFEIKNVPNETSVALKIYNIWGNLVYISDDYKNDWNGNSSIGKSIGSPAGLPDGTYFYLVRLSDGRVYVRGFTLTR